MLEIGLTSTKQLQIDILFDISYTPGWLSIVLMSTGILIIFLTSLRDVFRAYYVSSTGIINYLISIRLAVIISLSIGSILVIIPLIKSQSWLFVLFLISAGSFFEGAATVRLYPKLLNHLHTQNIPGSFKTKIKFISIVGFASLISSLAAVGILLNRTPSSQLGYQLRIIWTFTTLFLSLAGFLWNVWFIKKELPIMLSSGFIISIAGTSIHNFGHLGQELIVLFITGITYSAGYWTNLFLWMRQRLKVE